MTSKLDELSVNTIRMLSADAVQKANSGHPGMPMGAASMAYVLWTRFLKHNPGNPKWQDRDRFVLSAGHGSMLLYSLLHLTGYDLTIDDLKGFRQWGSRTAGHPEYGLTPGVEITTGPLGQGFASGVGMALAEQFLSARFNRPGLDIVNHFIYGIVSDGDLMEGVSHEAASLAGHLALGKLIYLYDDNQITIEGSTDIAFTEDRSQRFRAYNWHVQEVADGNDLEAIENAIHEARAETLRPSLIAVRTHIGFGSPNKQDKASAHGEPLGPDELVLTKEKLGWPVDRPFFVPDEVREHFVTAVEKGIREEDAWKACFHAYAEQEPDMAAEWDRFMKDVLPAEWDSEIPVFPPDAKGMASRVASGKVLNAIAQKVHNLMGGSADLAPSNKTEIVGETDFQPGSYKGRNFRFGVREHGMGSILNGMALHGGIIPYGGTFLIFCDYMRPAIRLAALMGLKVIYVFTHDSIGLGEDGPTHQPVEQLASLRAIPNLTLLRPCDGNETAEAWKLALTLVGGPVALALTRQGLPTLDRTQYASASNVRKGAYILKDFGNRTPDLILISTGSEIHITLAAATVLSEKGKAVRVVSMPSWELFDKQTAKYKLQVLPPEIKARISIEAGSSMGWHRFVGEAGETISLDHFGASAPSSILFREFGFGAERIVERAMRLV
mgnify:FL=1